MSHHDAQNRQVVVVSRPRGLVGPEHFEVRLGPVPQPSDGQFLVRTLLLSIDPAQRAFLNETPTYGSVVRIGHTMWGDAVGEVVETRNRDFAVGDLVEGWLGWQDFAVIDERRLGVIGRLPPGLAAADALGGLGLTGLTAYFGLLEIGRPRKGETVVVSAAAGATGSVAAQIARLKGCTVIGIAGGARKCRWLSDVAHLDHTIDYKSEDVGARLRELAPDGVDVYFDNVGGSILDAVLAQLALHARVVLCGGVSSGYASDEALPAGPKNYVKLPIKRARMEGFVVGDYAEDFAAALVDLRAWRATGLLVCASDIEDGLENAPRALRRLFEGGNLGKQLVRVAEATVASARADSLPRHDEGEDIS
jgi:NADPH-dependent curcumin reductase CurA